MHLYKSVHVRMCLLCAGGAHTWRAVHGACMLAACRLLLAATYLCQAPRRFCQSPHRLPASCCWKLAPMRRTPPVSRPRQQATCPLSVCYHTPVLTPLPFAVSHLTTLAVARCCPLACGNTHALCLLPHIAVDSYAATCPTSHGSGRAAP